MIEMIKGGSKWSTLTNFRTQWFWPTSRPEQGSKAKIKRGSSRFTWGGGKFKQPHASFVDQTQGFIVWQPLGAVWDKEKQGKGERRERKRREKEKKRKASELTLVLPRGTTKRTWVFFNFSRWFLEIYFHKTLDLCIGMSSILISQFILWKRL